MFTRSTNYILNVWGLTFLFGCLAAFLKGYKEPIPDYMLFMQFFIAFLYYWALRISLYIYNEKHMLIVMFACFALLTFSLRYVFISYTGDPYSQIFSADIYAYERDSILYSNNNLFNYIRAILKMHRYGIDDLGFTIYMYVIYKLIQDVELTRIFLLLINALFITYSSYILYKICMILKINERISIFASSLYGMFPYFVSSSVMGLKENLFCMLIVTALYYMYKYKENRRINFLLLAIFFTASTYLFRYAICLMLILVFLLLLYCNEKNKKSAILVSLIFCIILLVTLNIIISTLTRGTVTMDHVYQVAESRMSRSGGLDIVGWLIHGLAAFFGPFPSITRTGQYGIYHSSGLLLKCLLNYFVFLGIYHVVRKYNYYFYPIILYFLMGLIMLLGSGTSFDIRYHITFFPALILLVAYELQNGKLHKFLFSLYSIISIIVISLYNLR